MDLSKKLQKDPSKKLIAGVASGIAKSYGIDITLVRVLFVLTTIIYGFGFWLYLALWLIMPSPEGTTVAEKVVEEVKDIKEKTASK